MRQGVGLVLYDNVNVTPVLAKNIVIDIKTSSFILFLKLEVFYLGSSRLGVDRALSAPGLLLFGANSGLPGS